MEVLLVFNYNQTAQASLMPKKIPRADFVGGKIPFNSMVVIETASYVTKQLTPATKYFMIIVDRTVTVFWVFLTNEKITVKLKGTWK